MKFFLSCAAMMAMVLLAWNADGADQVQKKAPVKKGTYRTTPGTKKKSSYATSKSGKKSTGKHTSATWRNRQMAPSPDRYREIQQALASKGYLSAGDATGTWNANSVEALKKFQAEQNLDANGKINSLSLIALGLGPKRETPVTPPPPPQH
jgi:hypothetical protein